MEQEVGDGRSTTEQEVEVMEQEVEVMEQEVEVMERGGGGDGAGRDVLLPFEEESLRCFRSWRRFLVALSSLRTLAVVGTFTRQMVPHSICSSSIRSSSVRSDMK